MRPTADPSAPTANALGDRLGAIIEFDPDDQNHLLGERGPDGDLVLHPRSPQHLSDEEKNVVRTLIEAVVLRHEAQRWTPAAS